jgi:hypothetical protein
MSDKASGVRRPDEIRELLRDIETMYELGGPPIGPEPKANWDAVEAHGLILAWLDRSDMSTPDLFHVADVDLDNAPGLRATFRLLASYAAMMALTWVLNEASPLGSEGPATREQVLDAASAIAGWDTSSENPPRW